MATSDVGRDQRHSRLMTGNPVPLVAVQGAPCTIAGHPAFLAGTQPASVPDVRIGHGWHGGFARDFATADGERVMVAALTRQQFVDLARTTRLGRTFACLERLLNADFSTCGDLYTRRATIAALLAPWFSRHTVTDLAAAFAGTSMSWARLDSLTGQPWSRR